MEQILLAYGVHKETVAAIRMLNKNMKVKFRFTNRVTDYFNNVAGVLQGDTLAPYLFIICLDYMLRTSIEKIKDSGFKQTKKRNRSYTAQTITDVDYADDIALLANTPARAETQLHSIERAAAGIGLHFNADKTTYVCFNKRGSASSLNNSSLKLVEKEAEFHQPRQISTCDGWEANNRLSVIWKSDQTDKKYAGFPSSGCVDNAIGEDYMDAN